MEDSFLEDKKLPGYLSCDMVCRYFPALAEKIGVIETLVLLQIDYWLVRTKHIRDGYPWFYKSIRDFEAELGMNRETIRRVLRKLEQIKLIHAGNFNKNRWDKTQWFTINYKNVEMLNIAGLEVTAYLTQNEPSMAQNESGGDTNRVIDDNKSCHRSSQFVPTLPEKTTKDLTNNSIQRKKDSPVHTCERDDFSVEEKSLLPPEMIEKMEPIKEEFSINAWEKILNLKLIKINDGFYVFLSQVPFTKDLEHRIAELLDLKHGLRILLPDEEYLERL